MPGSCGALEVLESRQIQYEERVLPPSGEGLAAYTEEARDRGIAVVIVGTYHAYTDEQIPTVVQSLLPIISFVTGPMPTTLDKVALHVPSTGFGDDGAVNAALQAAKILALADSELAQRLRVKLGHPPES